MVGEGEGRRRREEMVLEKEALAAIYTFVIKCHKEIKGLFSKNMSRRTFMYFIISVFKFSSKFANL